MTPTQKEALDNVIHTQEELQEVWSKPRVFNLPGNVINRQALVVTCVVSEGEKLKWAAAVRLYHPKRQKIKRAALFTASERNMITSVLKHELKDVGYAHTEAGFRSEFALHLTRDVTDLELSAKLKPHLTGTRPALVREDEAKSLLTKLEEDLGAKTESRIIQPKFN